MTSSWLGFFYVFRTERSPKPAPLPLHGSPLRRAACAMLTVASSEPLVPLTLRRPGGDNAYTPVVYTGHSDHV